MGIFGGFMKGFFGFLFLVVFLAMSIYMEMTNIKIKNLEKKLDDIAMEIENINIPLDNGVLPITKCDIASMNPECVIEQMRN